MKKSLIGLLLLVLIGVATPPLAWSASPCDGVDRVLTKPIKLAWERQIAKQLRVETVVVLQSFRFRGWTIVYVDSHNGDEAFLFYSHDPVQSRYITIWSGAAAFDEEQSIRDWTLKNAPGIPSKLASCFAWHVTNDRDK